MKTWLSTGPIWPERLASAKTNHTIQDTWTIYGKIMIKDLHGHVKIINNEQELLDITQH